MGHCLQSWFELMASDGTMQIGELGFLAPGVLPTMRYAAQLLNPALQRGRALTDAVFLRTSPRRPGSSIVQSIPGCVGLQGRSAPLPSSSITRRASVSH